jgi:hypothetical protein
VFPAGTAGDVNGNTLACHQYHVDLATGGDAVAKDTHCPHASPSGGGVCGTTCDAFCSAAVATCGTEYADAAACSTACAGFAAGAAGATSGDSLACRQYHVGLATTSSANADTHCPHAGPSGGGICVAPATPTPSHDASGASSLQAAKSFALCCFLSVAVSSRRLFD